MKIYFYFIKSIFRWQNSTFPQQIFFSPGWHGDLIKIIYYLGNTVSLPYLIYKIGIALLLVTNQILSITKYPYASDGNLRQLSKYWIYATHWGVILFTITFNLDTILVLARYIIQVRRLKTTSPHHYENCHFILRLSMVLTSIAYPWILGKNNTEKDHYLNLFWFSGWQRLTGCCLK